MKSHITKLGQVLRTTSVAVRKSRRPNAVAEAQMRRQLATMRAGIYIKDHVAVRYQLHP